MPFISKEFDDTYGLVLEISEDKSYYIVKDFKREVLHSDEVYIPETFGGLPVCEIASYAFYGCESVKEVTIFKCVEKVCYASFLSCKYLKSVIYLGSKKEWKKIDFTKENKNLLKAKITFLE